MAVNVRHKTPGKSGRGCKNKRGTPKAKADPHHAAQLDLLAEVLDMIPGLRRDITKKLSAEEIRTKYNSLLTAIDVHTGLTHPDARVRHAVTKDINDRVEGTAVQRSKTEHKFEDMEREELEAMVLTRLTKLQNDEKEDHTKKTKH